MCEHGYTLRRWVTIITILSVSYICVFSVSLVSTVLNLEIFRLCRLFCNLYLCCFRAWYFCPSIIFKHRGPKKFFQIYVCPAASCFCWVWNHVFISLSSKLNSPVNMERQESHIHSLMNVLRYCNLDESLQGEPSLVCDNALERLYRTKELDYMSYIVLRLFENTEVGTLNLMFPFFSYILSINDWNMKERRRG